MSGKPLGVIDKLFIYGETRESMMHVAGLMVFSPPEGDPGFVRRLVDDIHEHPMVTAPWNRRLATPWFWFNPMHSWVDDENFDLDYHVRHSALPAPGGERELGKLISRLHGHPLDFRRPPWEMHIIEGLAGGRFAIYAKVHHSLVDGYTANKIMTRSLSTSPRDKNKPMYFALPEPARTRRPRPEKGALDALNAAVDSLRDQATTAAELTRPLRELIKSAVARDPDLKSPMQAPNSILNQRIGRNRRFATQQYSLERLRALAQASGGTLNDVVIALCAGGLRRFLDELGELPDAPLVAFIPVNIRPKDDPGGGNAIGAALVSMATDVAAPTARLAAIIASTTRAKEQFKGMSQTAIMEYSALLMSPYLWQLVAAMAGNVVKLPVTFNLCISNVPGPSEPLFLRGARLDAIYPVSIPAHAMALNITVQSYAGMLDFGFIGCRDRLPHLQKLAVYTGEALDELERALLKPPRRGKPRVAKAGVAAAKPTAQRARRARKPAAE